MSNYNKFNLIESDSESESDAESDSKSDAESDNHINNEDNIEQLSQLNIKDNDDNIKNNENNKINKKIRDKIKKNKKEERNNLYIENKKVDKLNNKTIFSDKVEIMINGLKLIEESQITINEKTKYSIIGKNGIGKTTLIKHLYEKLVDEDCLLIEQDIYIDNIEQKISDFILDANKELHDKFKILKLLEEKDYLTDAENEEYEILSEEIYSNGWDKFEAESKKILDGLGFNDYELPVNILSGGWRMRLALGKALLRCPNILILDEPTNHLDLNAVIWLTDYLYNYKKTLIIISHQIHLINTISNVIWYIGNPELKGTKIYTVHGNYFKVNKMIDFMYNESINNYEKFTKKINELRKKSTPKKDVDEFIKKNNILRPPKPYEVIIEFDKVNDLSFSNIIEFKNVTYSYDTKEIFNNINFSISMNQKLIIVGDNGIGKTTLFKLCAELIKPNSGIIIKDTKLKIGYYHQQIIDNLPLIYTPIQYLQYLDDKLSIEMCRGILGKLGIKKTEIADLPNTQIYKLSGGQKARISLASIQIMSPHLILMDEPTNHLDLESIEGLIKGINNYNGGIVIITHDMYLIESIENGIIYEISNKKINKFNENFDEYCNKII
jgi:ATP-binding cassette subfamily F protein 1